MFHQRWSPDRAGADTSRLIPHCMNKIFNHTLRLLTLGWSSNVAPVCKSFKWADIREEIHWLCRGRISPEKTRGNISQNINDRFKRGGGGSISLPAVSLTLFCVNNIERWDRNVKMAIAAWQHFSFCLGLYRNHIIICFIVLNAQDMSVLHVCLFFALNCIVIIYCKL